MAQPEPIRTSIAPALIQCVSLTSRGWRGRVDIRKWVRKRRAGQLTKVTEHRPNTSHDNLTFRSLRGAPAVISPVIGLTVSRALPKTMRTAPILSLIQSPVNRESAMPPW